MSQGWECLLDGGGGKNRNRGMVNGSADWKKGILKVSRQCVRAQEKLINEGEENII